MQTLTTFLIAMAVAMWVMVVVIAGFSGDVQPATVLVAVAISLQAGAAVRQDRRRQRAL